jgi:hypothetical protein
VKLPALTPRRLAIVALGAIVALCGAFAVGRWSRPAMVRTTAERADLTRAQWYGATVSATKETRRNVESERHRTFDPQTGKLLSETLKLRDLSTSGATRNEASQGGAKTEEHREATTTEKPAAKDWHLSVQAGWNAAQLRPNVYGVQVERRIAGPVWLGVWGNSTRAGGASLSLEW